MDGQELKSNNFTVLNTANINISNSKININGVLHLDLAQSSMKKNRWNLNNSSVESLNNLIELSDTISVTGTNNVNSKIIAKELYLNGILNIDQNIVMDGLVLAKNSQLKYTKEDTVVIKNYFTNEGDLNNLSTISGANVGFSILSFKFRDKLCLEYINISNIKVIGDVIVNVSNSGITNNNNNISQGNCEDILFADFNLSELCVGTRIKINNKSSGNNIESFKWEINGGYVFNNDDEFEPIIVFNSFEEEHKINLTITNANGQETFERTFDLKENSLNPVSIITNDKEFISSREGESYKWFVNGRLLEGYNQRIIPIPSESGVFQVEYLRTDSVCQSRISEPLIYEILSNISFFNEVKIYPNPTKSIIHITGLKVNDQVIIYDMLGKLRSKYINKNTTSQPLDVGSFEKGLYIIKLVRGSKIKQFKFIKE